MKLIIILLAIIFDFIIRERQGLKFHPLIGIGNIMNSTWKKFKHKNPLIEKINGVFYALIFVVGVTSFVYFLLRFLEFNYLIYAIASAIILNYCVAISSFFDHAKPLKGFKGARVLEIVDDYDGDTYRSIYTVQFVSVVYVLHAFQKKSKKGIATPQSDIKLIKQRLKQAKEHYDAYFKS